METPLSVAWPDLCARPFRLISERTTTATPELLFRAWTEQFDCWFAAPGTLLMNREVATPFFFQTKHAGMRRPHCGRFLRLHRDRFVEITWLTSRTNGAETVVTVEFRPPDAATHLLLKQAGFPDEESNKRHAETWPMVLAQLDQRMARQI
jgi:uncharacterized protein YndB with AHSA1/START domain